MHQVFLHGIGHVQPEDFLAGGEDCLLADPALGLGFAVECLATGLLENAALHRGVRETDFHMHEEAV
ncbi:hypothetical protein D3C78_1891660 [compost metagenome]